jgi:hypothetical protein
MFSLIRETIMQYVGIRDIIGRPEITKEAAEKNRRLGKGPRKARPPETGMIRGGRTWFYKMIKLGVFPPPVKVGRKSLWKAEEIGKALERFEAKS